MLDVKEEYSNDQKNSNKIGENSSISADPLGAEMANSNSLSTSQSHQNQFEKLNQIKPKQTLRTTNSLKNVNSTNPFLSPSREKFIREHSASPFSAENNEGGDKISLNSDKRKKKSFRATSWLKSIASNSPILNTLIPGNSGLFN